MPLTDTVSSDIAVAMKAKDTVRLSALRMLKAAIMNKGVEKGRDLDDSEVLQVVASLVKQRRDSIEQFQRANRQDLVDQERFELSVLAGYQPEQASAGELEAAIAAAIAATGAAGASDMGKVMGVLKPKLAGRADMSAVSAMVKAALAKG